MEPTTTEIKSALVATGGDQQAAVKVLSDVFAEAPVTWREWMVSKVTGVDPQTHRVQHPVGQPATITLGQQEIEKREHLRQQGERRLKRTEELLTLGASEERQRKMEERWERREALSQQRQQGKAERLQKDADMPMPAADTLEEAIQEQIQMRFDDIGRIWVGKKFFLLLVEKRPRGPKQLWFRFLARDVSEESRPDVSEFFERKEVMPRFFPAPVFLDDRRGGGELRSTFEGDAKARVYNAKHGLFDAVPWDGTPIVESFVKK